MMRFPLRLSAAMARACLARRLGQGDALFQRMDAAEILHASSAHPVEHESLRALLRQESKSIVWIGGGEPLDHAGIAPLVRALTRSGRMVFLETDGVALRRRIHEFQPVANSFFAVRFDDARPEHSKLAFEGLRAARLSGFHTAALSRLSCASHLASLQVLRRSLEKVGVDGWLVCAATEAARRLAAQARLLIAHLPWRKFSQFLERELAGNETQQARFQHVPSALSEPRQPLIASTTRPMHVDPAVEESAPAS